MSHTIVISPSNRRAYDDYDDLDFPQKVHQDLLEWLAFYCPQDQYRLSDYAQGEYIGERWHFKDRKMAIWFALVWA